MAKLHATTPDTHLGQGERVILPKTNGNRRAPRHNFENKQQGELEEEYEKSHERFLCIEIGLLEAETRGVAYALIMFTAGVKELVLVVFIETVGKAPRQGLISRRRPGLHGSNHSTSVMAFGAKGSENQGRQSWVQRCGEPPGPLRPAAPGGTTGEAGRRLAEPPEGRGALPLPGSRGEDEEPSAIFPCPPKHQRCRATRRGLRGRRCRHPPPVIPTPARRPTGPSSPPPPRRTPLSRTPTRGAPSPGSASPPLCTAAAAAGCSTEQLPPRSRFASPRPGPGPGLGPGSGPARAQRSATHPRTASPCPAAAAATARCPPGCCRRNRAGDCLIPGSQQGRVSCQAPRTRTCSRLTEGAAPLTQDPPGQAPCTATGGKKAKLPPLPALQIPDLAAPLSPAPAAPLGRFSCVTSSCPAALGFGSGWGLVGACALRSAPSGDRAHAGEGAHTHPAPLAGAWGSAGRQRPLCAGAGRRAGRKVAAEGPARAAGALRADGSVRVGAGEGGGWGEGARRDAAAAARAPDGGGAPPSAQALGKMAAPAEPSAPQAQT